MVWSILILAICVLLFQTTLPAREVMAFTLEFGLIPSRVFCLDGLYGVITYIFLHSGWWHAITNMWMFWIFADNVEDIMGPWRFLIFYLACGFVAGVAHVVANATSPIPVVGASGAVSGVLGAYFLLYPHAKILTFVFLFILRIPAALYLGGWFLLQLFSAFGEGTDSIAWWTHLGGFIAGMLLMPLFRDKKRGKPGERIGRVERSLPDAPDDPWARYRSKRN